MITNSESSAVAADLRAIRKWCSFHSQAPPSSAVAYIDANRELLLCLIDRASVIPSSERRLLLSRHRELDDAATLDDFSVARQAVDQAHQVIAGNKLAEFLDDDVNMILRPIEYAKYVTSEDCPQLTLSPLRLPS